MSSQKQDIDGSFENSNVVQNQAWRDVISFQNSHENRVNITNTFSLLPKSESPQVNWNWANKLLTKQLSEIRQRLRQTLGDNRLLMDISIEKDWDWRKQPDLQADRTLQIDNRDYGTLNPNKMLIETFYHKEIMGELLILGAPGSGKTTALLSLAEQLICGAIAQPKTIIPVIFELSTWQDDNQSIKSWLIDRLHTLYGRNRKSKIYEQWLEEQVLLPLMDGLDELGLERQKRCTEKLNEFICNYLQTVVCCRSKEFATGGIPLETRGTVCLQQLSNSQISDYFISLNRPDLGDTIQTNSSLQALMEPTIEGEPGLLRVPLFVTLLPDVYDPQQPIISKADLLDKYIRNSLSFKKREKDRIKGLKNYKWSYKMTINEPNEEKTHDLLKWVAQNLQINNNIDFIIEQMQPSLLVNIKLQRRYQSFFGLTVGLIFGLFFSLTLLLSTFLPVLLQSSNYAARLNEFLSASIGYNIIFTLFFWLFFMFGKKLIFKLIIGTIFVASGNLLGLLFCLVIGLIVRLIGSLDRIEPLETFQFSMSNIAKKINLKHLIMGLFYGVFIGIIVSSIRTVFLAISNYVAPQVIGLPHGEINLHKYLIYALTWGSINGSLIGLTLGLISGLISGLKEELKVRDYPNQGIWQSLKIQIFITVIIVIIISLLFIRAKWIEGFSLGLFIALVVGFSIGGGKAILQHISLRIVLWQSGLPLNLVRFLNYCVERRLLLRVGGSYRFLHRELQEQFVHLEK